jgi:brefeldin A-inhibited guanine nucleotide-exchange protein
VGCDENPTIAMYAIDSLKQLATKFLAKKELANYHFQKEFIKPFEQIMAKNNSVTIRQLVIECLATMIKSRAMNIKSGWKSIFIAFTVAASDHDGTSP